MTLAVVKAYSDEVAKVHDNYMYYYMLLAIFIAILAYESVRRVVAKVVAWFAAQAAREQLMQQEQTRLQERLRLLEQSKTKEGM